MSGWTWSEADHYLRTHQVWGLRFGLDRMHRLMTVLGQPHERFASIHVVGTNGKSSTTRMTAALLERHGLRTATYTSPHLISYAERIEVGERMLPPDELASAIERAAAAAQRVERTLAEDDVVTQFEVLTAAAYLAIAERGVDVAVVEAGLGARYDATSVIDPRVHVLTNVGLEHTRWLGPTVGHIAAEKLAVVPEGGTLVVGYGLAPEVQEMVQALPGVRLRVAARQPRPAVARALRARGDFQQRNFALALASAETFLGRELDPGAVLAAARETVIPGRLELVADDPPVLLDGAHNPDSIEALVDSLPAVAAGRPLSVVLSILDDKDAAAMMERLARVARRLIVTRTDSERALPAATLLSLAGQLGIAPVECHPRAADALARARELAAGEQGAVLVCGSIYLVGELLSVLRSEQEALQGARIWHTHAAGSTGA
ncbi:MAG TPA: cyanophycin synthetase [Solirubrobacteraceae bacterium]|jgi:dihydrofolate synthase/folylpolyglutamate synthase|nr:cyanophycin synthetase [Solirubrobacteraceae bacterium]